VVAEIELDLADQVPELPEWVGEVVTDDVRASSGTCTGGGLRHSHCRPGPV
jgi:CYTH domain-containing protein